MSRSLPILAAAAALFTLSLPAAAAFQVDGKPKVSFFAEGSPGALDIEGKTSDLTLSDDGTTVTATVALEGLDTGIDLRDHHMKEKFMQVQTFPTAALSFARADLPLPTDVGKSTNGTLNSTFSCHGVDLPAVVTYQVKKSKTGYAVDATFEYNANAHGIETPSYLGITVSPDQNARVRFNMTDQ